MTQPHYGGTLQRMLDNESEIGEYNAMSSSLKTEDFNFGPTKKKSHGHNYSDTQSETHSIASYATSVYSEITIGQGPNGQKTKKYQKKLPQHNQKNNKNPVQTKINQFNVYNHQYDHQYQQPTHPKDEFGQKIHQQTIRNIHKLKKLSQQQQTQKNADNSIGGGLSKKLNSQKIRESVEMDFNTSMLSNGSISHDIRPSEFEKQSVITLRMIANNPSKQIRLKLYLPNLNNFKPQIIVLFVNKGTTMGICKSFLEDSYPKQILNGKIKQLCIADDDGDIDEDFPPINENQDVTTLGVQNFWIDRIFDIKQDKFKNKISPIMESIPNKDKHRDTIKEQLLNKKTTDYGGYDDDDDDEMENTQKKCFCCCFRNKKISYNEFDDDDDESDDEDESNDNAPDESNVEINSIKETYVPPLNNLARETFEPSGIFEPNQVRNSQVQYAVI